MMETLTVMTIREANHLTLKLDGDVPLIVFINALASRGLTLKNDGDGSLRVVLTRPLTPSDAPDDGPFRGVAEASHA